MNDNLLATAPAQASTGVDAMLLVTIIAGIVAALIVIILLAKAIKWMRKSFGRPELHGMSEAQIRAHWQEIEKLTESGRMGAKMAIVEADKLLDSALKSMAMSGNTLGERLKFACYKYPELRNVWNAHKLRNRLVHEHSFEPSTGEARAAIRDFKRALQILKVL